MASAAIALDGLVPGAVYYGTLDADDEEAYDALDWQDPRPKPTWEEVRAWTEPVKVPESVTMMQARMAMLNAGILDQVQAAIGAMSGTEGQAAQIQWQFAQEVRRDWPLVLHLQSTVGLTDQQVDDLFIAAAGIQ
ncbi:MULTISPECIES: hypothetical protein [unclassified Pseudomonas]|uniref:hypothetical protein n=1 Tax=unclassified Pseudomonas TaxID=196821 RepID=UPI000BCFB665|nr:MULTISPECIES: hypothetical protein [unclassified Pseudomonas]PVZ19910.1 hypothetical protein F474_00501 [Pseudomonas sp. URIL14HWK12:I12]PVZ26976.1 hypothetical protein F470_00156 [Pseudomonas sp. URIL14HWK12:I10]PVZ37865.1 hypothetical protein F472_00501 [Pseudomonas sp. URIL14HWK12:I11]SNZ05358.1 hypothetical protein SAMN05660463_00903 [Pseudomonas sp. URIL14HWK12:I9]